ncbi:hypothetical protein CRG98_029420 [Punica granatum]|uniref:Uncharacterized protein n=1 Tax=Punica granatum TaxID=22663 RepID=A0A2I0J375_PUNGR|nr:hypothetical protein CRG98_029420 [Punica granatum]
MRKSNPSPNGYPLSVEHFNHQSSRETPSRKQSPKVSEKTNSPGSKRNSCGGDQFRRSRNSGGPGVRRRRRRRPREDATGGGAQGEGEGFGSGRRDNNREREATATPLTAYEEDDDDDDEGDTANFLLKGLRSEGNQLREEERERERG